MDTNCCPWQQQRHVSYYVMPTSARGRREKRSKPKHCYKVRCGFLRSSDIVYGLRVQKLKPRKKYVRRERVKLGPFVKLTEEQALIAATALLTASVKKAPTRYRRKKNQNQLAPQSGLYQTMFENFVNSRQEKKPNCQHLLTIVLFAMLISDSAYVFLFRRCIRRSCLGASVFGILTDEKYFPKICDLQDESKNLS